jgi:hypothetical protein
MNKYAEVEVWDTSILVQRYVVIDKCAVGSVGSTLYFEAVEVEASSTQSELSIGFLLYVVVLVD